MNLKQWTMFGGLLLTWWAAVVSGPLCFGPVGSASIHAPMTPTQPLWLELSGVPVAGDAPRRPRIGGGGEDGDGLMAVGEDARRMARTGVAPVVWVVDPVRVAARRGLRARGPPAG